MSVSVIVLAKDRVAQLDLLLTSLARNWPEARPVIVTAPAGQGFEDEIRRQLERAGEFVCFMCDDGIVYRPVDTNCEKIFASNFGEEVLTLSLRLGENTRISYPSGRPNAVLYGIGPHCDDYPSVWDWDGVGSWEEAGDVAYPGSIDGHVFRRDDLLEMLDGQTFPNPTALECCLVDGCQKLADRRPLMACYPQSVYVGVPVNRVSEQSGVRFGDRFPQPAEELNARYRAGERIDLDALDFTQVDGAHCEIEFVWRRVEQTDELAITP